MPLQGMGHEERMYLELLAIGDIALSPDIIQRNWNVAEQRSERILTQLANRGLVSEVGDNFYRLTDDASSVVKVRSAAD